MVASVILIIILIIILIVILAIASVIVLAVMLVIVLTVVLTALALAILAVLIIKSVAHCINTSFTKIIISTKLRYIHCRLKGIIKYGRFTS